MTKSICCETKILFVSWKNMAYKPNELRTERRFARQRNIYGFWVACITKVFDLFCWTGLVLLVLAWLCIIRLWLKWMDGLGGLSITSLEGQPLTKPPITGSNSNRKARHFPRNRMRQIPVRQRTMLLSHHRKKNDQLAAQHKSKYYQLDNPEY